MHGIFLFWAHFTLGASLLKARAEGRGRSG